MFGLDGIAIPDVVAPPDISCAEAAPTPISAVPAMAATPAQILATFIDPPLCSSVASPASGATAVSIQRSRRRTVRYSLFSRFLARLFPREARCARHCALQHANSSRHRRFHVALHRPLAPDRDRFGPLRRRRARRRQRSFGERAAPGLGPQCRLGRRRPRAQGGRFSQCAQPAGRNRAADRPQEERRRDGANDARRRCRREHRGGQWGHAAHGGRVRRAKADARGAARPRREGRRTSISSTRTR